MWLMLSETFVSIVAKDCPRDHLMVRARRPGDIEKIFPSAVGRVTAFTASDYHYRCAVPRAEICNAICNEIIGIDYSNFKDTVKDDNLHHAYLRVWQAMADLQPQRPYAGRRRMRRSTGADFDDGMGDTYRPGAVIDVDDSLSALSPEEEAHVFATGHMPPELFDPEVTSMIENAKGRRSKRKNRSLKKGR